MLRAPKINNSSAGFSLVELTIVVVILGLLSMMAIPRYQQVVERTKCAEGLSYLAQIEGAQERHNARSGEYARSLSALDLKIAAPKHFRVGKFTSYDWQTKWQLRLIRDGASSGFGKYSVTWNQNGFYSAGSTAKAALLPASVVSGSNRGTQQGESNSKSGSSRRGDDDDRGRSKQPKKEKKDKKPKKKNKGKHERHEDRR
jgi:prepilin-type N-terminal cleavage/methylation domain-containing protein